MDGARRSDAPPERRPLTSRSTWWARALSARLVRAGASANGVSTLGLVFGCLAGAAFAATTHWPEHARWGFAAAAALIQLRLLCNMLDGMVALEGGTSSALGELFNEAPDRLSDAATMIGAGYAFGATPAWGWSAACVALWVAYVRALAKTAGAPTDFCGPMAKPHRMALMTAAALVVALAPAAWLERVAVIDCALGVVVFGGLLTSARRLAHAARALREAR